MKLYNNEDMFKQSLTYNQALKEMKNGNIVTRQEWDGVHMIRNNKYYILTKSGIVIVNPYEIKAQNKCDWVVVIPNKECLKIMSKHGILSLGEITLLYDAYQSCLIKYRKCHNIERQRGF